ncbi:ras guanine nucleotide exchange factor domain-containing protein [Phycomyces nitens]|nr:ras guanine nucleotide exchange factor domain-containing protein [Phycomyces nitens]
MEHGIDGHVHKKTHREGNTLCISEDGKDVLVMEMVNGKLQVVAGTIEKLFIKLADEASQDLDYVDTYLMNHACFTTSAELLENLIARFHIEALAGETEYFDKWQRCIQLKVLNVISRWIKIQYQDFNNSRQLLRRLELFVNNSIKQAGFSSEAKTIREALDIEMAKCTRSRHSLVALTLYSLVGSGQTTPPSTPCLSSFSIASQQQSRRPSLAPSLLSFVSSMTPPDSPVALSQQQQSNTPLLLLYEAKDIAKYLTLADFYTFKCITAHDYLTGQWKNQSAKQKGPRNYIGTMTRRANMLTHWVAHELCILKTPKQRKTGLKKMIEIAKLCLEWNNFHTSMILTMGLTSRAVQRLDDWQALPSRDTHAFHGLQKYLDVSSNMATYRQAFNKVKSPAIPFLPLVLKDLTFFVDGNPTRTASSENLINFAKFQSLARFMNRLLSHTSENYSFAGELEHFPFFFGVRFYDEEKHGLDGVAETVEQRIEGVADCYNDTQCVPL